jgi:glutathione-specific gamma-glutamylcyclotransferase
MIARAKGMFGSNFVYLSDMHKHLEVLGFEDNYITKLFSAVGSMRDTST